MICKPCSSFRNNEIKIGNFNYIWSPYNKKNITRWLKDMNFMFSWQKRHLTRSLRSLVRYRFCHSNIKFISSRHRVISSIYESIGYVFQVIQNHFLEKSGSIFPVFIAIIRNITHILFAGHSGRLLNNV